MKQKKLLAGCGAVLALTLGSTALAAGARPSASTVTVRVEGLHRTLLNPTAVKTHAGSLTRFGAPTGKCPDHSAAGALDGATHHRWKGIWESSFGDYEVTSILGETHAFSSKDFWEIFVNNVAAQTGACEIKLKPGERIVFAAVDLGGRRDGVAAAHERPAEGKRRPVLRGAGARAARGPADQRCRGAGDGRRRPGDHEPPRRGDDHADAAREPPAARLEGRSRPRVRSGDRLVGE